MEVSNLYRVIQIGLVACTLSAYGQQGSKNNVEQRVQSIFSLMTLDEKLNYISGGSLSLAPIKGVFDIKPISRLGLPEIFWTDGTIGLTGQGFAPGIRYPVVRPTVQFAADS